MLPDFDGLSVLEKMRRDDPDILLCDMVTYATSSVFDSKHIVTSCGEECNLTFKEYELLKYLLKNKGMALTRENIILNVWGYDFEGESRTVDMHITTLRQKLGSCGNLIKTVRNVGYKAGE